MTDILEVLGSRYEILAVISIRFICSNYTKVIWKVSRLFVITVLLLLVRKYSSYVLNWWDRKENVSLDVFPFCWYLCYHEEMKSRVIPVCPLSYYCSPDSAKANYFMWLCTVICQRSLSQLMKSGMNGKSNLNWSLDAGKDWSNKLSLKTTQLLLVLMYLQRRYLLNNHSFDIFLKKLNT